mgnify:CR=1 FL=1
MRIIEDLEHTCRLENSIHCFDIFKVLVNLMPQSGTFTNTLIANAEPVFACNSEAGMYNFLPVFLTVI